MKRPLTLLAAVPALLAQAPAPGPLEDLARCMAGAFSSAEQAREDPAGFSDIRLGVVRIWPGRTDGIWLYAEQAAADALGKPYRQRVYRLSLLPDGRLRSEVHAFKGDPLRHAGAWRQPAPLAGLDPSHLELREGCAVFLVADGKGAYLGGTRDRDCGSSLRGAAYATTEVRIDAAGMTSWDRGFDAAGRQVWGAVQGGYRFKRTE